MSRSKDRRLHKKLARIKQLKATNPNAFARKGARVLNEAISEASYRLHLLVDGDTERTQDRIGWKSFEDLWIRLEVYGLGDELEIAIAELTARRLCTQLAGQPTRHKPSKIIFDTV